MTSCPAAQLVVDPAGLVPLGADHVQTARLANLLLLLLHHLVVFRLHLANHLANALDLGIGGGGLLGGLGDAVLEFQDREGPVAPDRHEITAELAEGLLGGGQEGTGIEGAEGLRLAGGLEGVGGPAGETAAAGGGALGQRRQVA